MLAKAQALIIEDFIIVAEFYAQVLHDAGYTTEIITDGQIALNRLREIIPDVVVLDLNLPTVSGETILSHIRDDNRLATTRVLISTAEGTRSEQVSAKADWVLNKPVGYRQLHHLAERLHPTYQPA